MTASSSAIDHTSLRERVAALHALPLFLPTHFLSSFIVPRVVGTFVVLMLLFLVAVKVVARNDRYSLTQVYKIGYQLVNGIVNLTLGVLGLYFCGNRVTLPNQAETVEERITSPLLQEPHNPGAEFIYCLACLQLGYQLWALPVGRYFVQESTAMLVHHCAVIFVACLSAFFTNGFVFHNPYFFGLFELSSVPLALTNYCKDNHKTNTLLYRISLVTFAILFLWIRIYMMVPRKYDFLLLCWKLAQTSPNFALRVYLTCCCCASFFLASLQVFWATLILQGIYNILNKKRKTN